MFFFDYVYYRITQWKFKSQGSTGPPPPGKVSHLAGITKCLTWDETRQYVGCPLFSKLLNASI